MIEVLVVFKMTLTSVRLARERELSRFRWAMRTVLTWFGVELALAMILGIPIVIAEMGFGLITEEQSGTAFILFAYIPAIFAAGYACVRVHRRLEAIDLPRTVDLPPPVA